ncbi:MAG: hypothetical protein ACKVTZ_17260, partial [Bacteroidia bacterium]
MKFHLLTLFTCLSLLGFSQTITNVKFDTYTTSISLQYEIKNCNYGDNFRVLVECSTDGGWTYTLPVNDATGDIGKGSGAGIACGCCKRISWEAKRQLGFT